MNRLEWAVRLDALAAYVDHLEAVVHGRLPGPVPPYEPELAGLPDELRPRALVLLARADELASRAARRLREQAEINRAYG